MNSKILRRFAFLTAALCLMLSNVSQANGPTWSQLAPSGGPPSERVSHSGVYDAASNRMIIFGGDVACDPTNDTLVLSNANGLGGTPDWTELSPAGALPAARIQHQAVYDEATSRMIVFGGTGPGFCSFPPPLFNDVWVLSNANGLGGTPTWTQIFPAGTAPSPRSRSSMVYDPINNRTIVFGGNPNEGSCSGAVSDVWVLSNANGLGGTPTWTQLVPAGGPPSPRLGHSAVYDPANNRMAVFGGANACDPGLNDVWVLSNANGLGGTPTWTQLTPPGTLPPTKGGHSAVYDSTTNRMTIFGGGNASGSTNDVWVLAGANGLGDPASWTQLTPSGPLPNQRSSHTATLDAATQRMTIFGGFAPGRSNDVWVLSNALGDVPPVCVPPPSGLVSWWPGDGDASDIQGSNHGMLQNGATFEPGMVSQAFSFDGVDDYVSVAANPNLHSGAITIDLWVQARDLSNPPGTTASSIVTSNLGDFDGYQLQIHTDGGVGFVLGGGSSRTFYISSPSEIVAGEWYHVAVSYDGVGGIGSLKLHINGIQRTFTLALGGGFAEPSGPISYSGDYPLTIGRRNQPAVGNFSGLADEVEIFDRALSASEIQAIFNAGAAGKCKSPCSTDSEPPTLTACSESFSVTADLDSSGAVVNYTAPTASDNCAVASVVCSPPSGSVLPVGSTSVTCTATDASGNMASCAFTVTVLSPQQATRSLVNDVNAVVSQGTLNQGQGDALTSKLDAAVQKLDQGNGNAARNQLQAFINQVNALMNSGSLSAQQGQTLIDAATNIIAHIP